MSQLRKQCHQRFEELLGDLPRQGRIPQMANLRQHGNVSTLAHVTRVAYASLLLARRLRLRVSERELVRGAILHDYYLYDWHDSANPATRGHATQHPVRALANAKQDFDLTPKEENIIAAHMWPLPPTRVPKSREAWLVCMADKWCSLQETLFMRR